MKTAYPNNVPSSFCTHFPRFFCLFPTPYVARASSFPQFHAIFVRVFVTLKFSRRDRYYYNRRPSGTGEKTSSNVKQQNKRGKRYNQKPIRRTRKRKQKTLNSKKDMQGLWRIPRVRKHMHQITKTLFNSTGSKRALQPKTVLFKGTSR